MEDYLKELSDIPWINVVESVRAFDEYKHMTLMYRIRHRSFAISLSRNVRNSVDLLIHARPQIIFHYIIDTARLHSPVKYLWDKPEGEMTRKFAREEIRDVINNNLTIESVQDLAQPNPLVHGFGRRVWLSVRRPWEIIQNNEVSVMYGRFGCAIFHKDAKRVED